AGARNAPLEAEAVTVVIRLRHARPADVQRILIQMFAQEHKRVAVDDRTNAVIVSAPSEVLQRIHRLVDALDKEPDAATPGGPPTAEGAAGGSAGAAPLESVFKVFSLKNARAID